MHAKTNKGDMSVVCYVLVHMYLYEMYVHIYFVLKYACCMWTNQIHDSYFNKGK